MSGYLRRVLARTAGQPASSLRAPRPFRWSSQTADPFAAAEGTETTTAAEGSRSALGTGAGPPREQAARERPALSTPENASGGDHPASGPALEASRRRGLRGFERSASQGERGGSDEARPRSSAAEALARPTSGRPPAGHRELAETQPSPRAAAGERGQDLTLPPPARSLSRASDDRSAPATPAMPLPPARREASSAGDARALRAPAPAGKNESAAAHGLTVAVAEHAVPPRAPPPATTRTEIVIGRISVMVESARPPTPAPRTVVRHVVAPSQGPSEGGGLSTKFGLGQI